MGNFLIFVVRFFMEVMRLFWDNFLKFLKILWLMIGEIWLIVILFFGKYFGVNFFNIEFFIDCEFLFLLGLFFIINLIFGKLL